MTEETQSKKWRSLKQVSLHLSLCFQLGRNKIKSKTCKRQSLNLREMKRG
mgnify:CR=1 FL=1